MRRSTFASFVLLAACASSSETPQAAPPIQNATSFGGPDASVDAGPSECAETTKDVYVISEENTLYSYHPPTNELRAVGPLACPTGGALPTSMAVDRSGIAWVRHTDGSIWKVDTRTLDCTPSAYQAPEQGAAFWKFGMGFSTSSKGGSNEQLFLSDSSGAGLARLDLDAFKVAFVGTYDGELAGKTCELTGTGDGKLYGFFVTQPAQIAEISKGTGTIVKSTPLPGVYAGSAWAFSFYGGDFYVYTSADGNGGGPPRAGGGSDITRYRPSDGSITVVKPKVGFKIVGAGVSTCAPTEGPR